MKEGERERKGKKEKTKEREKERKEERKREGGSIEGGEKEKSALTTYHKLGGLKS